MQCKACGKEQICSPLPTSSFTITQTELLGYIPRLMFRFWFCLWLLLTALPEILTCHFPPLSCPALPRVLANLNRQDRLFWSRHCLLEFLYNTSQNS